MGGSRARALVTGSVTKFYGEKSVVEDTGQREERERK